MVAADVRPDATGTRAELLAHQHVVDSNAPPAREFRPSETGSRIGEAVAIASPIISKDAAHRHKIEIAGDDLRTVYSLDQTTRSERLGASRSQFRAHRALGAQSSVDPVFNLLSRGWQLR